MEKMMDYPEPGDNQIILPGGVAELSLSNPADTFAEIGMSPYDSGFAARFLSNSLETGLTQAENTAKDIYSAVTKYAPIAAQLAQIRQGSRLVVDVSDEMMKDILSGKIKLTTNKEGEVFAQILNPNGKFGKKLPIKREDFAVGLDPAAIATAIQLKAMQEKLEEISEQIKQIDQNVREVMVGQQNDRIAQYYSGVSLYMEALSVTDQDVRKALVAQALRALSDASFQLRLNLRMDVSYLENEEYKNEKGKRAKLIDARMANINKEFDIIHQTALFKAGIYCNEKEYGAMATALDDYSEFIKRDVASKAGFLAQCDLNDNGTNEGIWRSRAEWKLDTTEIRKKLTSHEKTIYIGLQGERKDA